MSYKYSEQDKAYKKQYYQKHKEAILTYSRAYYLKHKAEKLEYGRKYAKLNKERFKRYGRKSYKLNPEPRKEREREKQQKTRIEVLTHYGNGKCGCVRCGESRLACLTIDHINHLGKNKKRSGANIARWLKRQGYPKGYQTLCMNCQWVKRTENREWERVA